MNTASNDGGAFFNLMAPTYGCTITASSPAVVTCPTTALVSPATIRFSSLPGGLMGIDPAKTYYIDQDGFSTSGGSISFSVSLNPPGLKDGEPTVANNGAAGVLAYLPSDKIATTGTGGGISVTGAMFIENASGASLFGATQSVTIKPVMAGTATITNNISRTIDYQWGASLSVWDDVTFDMSHFGGNFKLPYTPQYMTIIRSRLVDPNGPVPPYGYVVNAPYGPFSNTGTTAAVVDSISSYYEGPKAPLMRNVRAWYGFDAYQFGVSYLNDNGASFNYHATKTQAWVAAVGQPDTGPLDMKVVSVGPLQFTPGYTACSHSQSIYTACYTDVTVQNVKSITNGVDTALVIYSGSLNARYFAISQIYNTSMVAASGSSPVNGTAIVRTYGDLTSLAAGDQVFIGGQGHSDAFQENGVGEGGTGNCSVASNHNMTMQRYIDERVAVPNADRSYGIPELATQGQLAQGGYCPQNRPNPNTSLVATGTSVTIGGFYFGQLQPGSIIVAGTKSDGSELTAVVTSATVRNTGTSSAILVAPFNTDDGTGNVSTTTWRTKSVMVASGRTVTITGASTYQILPDDIIHVGSTSGGMPIAARVKSATTNGMNHIVTLYTSLPTSDGTYSSGETEWDIGRGALGVLFQNSMIDQDPGSLYQFGAAQVHWVYQNVTFTGFLSNYPGSGSAGRFEAM